MWFSHVGGGMRWSNGGLYVGLFMSVLWIVAPVVISLFVRTLISGRMGAYLRIPLMPDAQTGVNRFWCQI